MNKIVTACVCICIFRLTADGSHEQQVQNGKEILQEAERLTDIWSGGIPSFRLTARVEAYDEKGNKKEGKYKLFWNSPTIWREEITFPNSSQTRFARVDKLLISRTPATPSEDIFRVEKLMEFPSLLRVDKRDEIRKVQEKTKGGSRERLIEIAVQGNPWKKLYFEESSPRPTIVEYKGAALGARYPYKEFDLKFELSDYLEFSGVQFPRNLRRFESKKLKAQVEVQEWVSAKYSESDFIPPDGSRWIRWCPHEEAPRIATRLYLVNVDFPPQLRPGGPGSRVVFYGVIGTDGQWHNIETVKSEGSMVDSFWKGLMLREKFHPAMCGENPVEHETMLEFVYP